LALSAHRGQATDKVERAGQDVAFVPGTAHRTGTRFEDTARARAILAKMVLFQMAFMVAFKVQRNYRAKLVHWTTDSFEF
jgi:hypothetical protein